jgi:NAD-dependent DNA ligase
MDIEGLGGETVAIVCQWFSSWLCRFILTYSRSNFAFRRMAQKSAENLVKGLRILKHSIWTRFVCFRDSFVGETVAKKLAGIKNIESLAQASVF